MTANQLRMTVIAWGSIPIPGTAIKPVKRLRVTRIPALFPLDRKGLAFAFRTVSVTSVKAVARPSICETMEG